jgi:hypothetical protein
MHRLRLSILSVVVAATWLCLASSTRAQLPPKGGGDTPAPAQTTSGEKPDTPTGQQAVVDQAKVDPALLTAFKKAYKDAGRPKFLFLVGIDRRADGEANAKGVGANLADFDPTGITEALSTGIGANLNDDGRFKQVDEEALHDAMQRDKANLAANDSDAAVDNLAQKLSADWVFYIKFTPTPPEARGQINAPYRCICELKNLNTSTKVPLAPFDWDGPIDNTNARRYAGTLTNLLCERFAKIVSAADESTDLTVKFIQLPSTDVANDLRKLLRKIDGVDKKSVKTPDVVASADGGTEATFDIEISDTEVADVQEALIKAAKDQLSLSLTVIKQGKNSITLSAAAGASGGTGPASPNWYLLTDSGDNPVKTEFLGQLKKNPIRVAVTINWLVSPDQMGWREQGKLPLIVMQGDPRLNNLPMGPQTVELEKMQRSIVNIYNELGIHVVDAATVQAIAGKEATKQTQLHDAKDLALILKSANACDYVCLGLATEVGNQAAEIPYTFKVTNCNSGDDLGGPNWPADPETLKSNPRNKRLLEKPENRARYVAGEMLLDIQRAIGGGQTMNATITGVDSLAQVQKLIDALKTIDDISTDGVRVDNGIGTFTIHYTGKYEDLSPRLSSVVDSLKPYKIVELNPGDLRLSAKGG